MSRANASIRPGVRPQTRIELIGRTSAWKTACIRAWMPVPRTPSVRSSRPSSRTVIATVAAVRTSVM